MINWWEIAFTETEANAAKEAILNGGLSQGAQVAKLEKKLAQCLQVPEVVVVNSGSAALLACLMALDVGPGDEVIVPDRTWIATANAALLLGAEVKVVDVEADRPVISPAAVARAITPRTKAIIPVHLNGRAADMTALNALIQNSGITLIEDACQAFGSAPGNVWLGSTAPMACFSLGLTKLLATGQGGFIAVQEKTQAQRLRLLRNHGACSQHSDAFDSFGFNFKMVDYAAAIGLAQLDKIAARRQHLQALYECYQQGLANLCGIELAKMQPGELPLYIEVYSEKRGALQAYLAKKGIGTRAVTPAVSQSPVINQPGSMPNADKFGRTGLYLPSGPDQTLENATLVCEVIQGFSHV